MIVTGLFALIIVVVVLAIIPKTSQAMASHRWRTIGLILFALAFLFGHPYLFGLPGRVAEYEFQSHIRPNMTRTEIVELAQKYGGSGPNFMRLDTKQPEYDWRSDGALFVEFLDFATLCISGGRDYAFYFKPDWTLTNWKVEDWGNAC